MNALIAGRRPARQLRTYLMLMTWTALPGGVRAQLTPPGTLLSWEVSRPFPASRVNREAYPPFLVGYQAEWGTVFADASGVVDLSRVHARSGPEPETVYARTLVRSDRKQDVRLTFGYADQIDLFVNKRKVFAGGSHDRQAGASVSGIRESSYTAYVTLERGLNEIFLMVTAAGAAWGWQVRTDPVLGEPLRRGAAAVRTWESPADFRTPESVLFDPRRNVLYVVSYDIPSTGSADSTGFISRVGPDGRILDLRWITGLRLPSGMAISGDRLYTLERQSLTEIDIEAGEIVRRHAIPEPGFPNDVAVDAAGDLYLTDTGSGTDRPSRILKFRDGRIEPWLESDEISRANAIWVHGDRLLVGNSGDGVLKAVDLRSRRVESIASLGWGVIDGIRVDANGDCLVSLWEGQVYRITPAGEVTEILDLYPSRLNTADFEYVAETRTFYFPTFLADRVVAFRLPPA